MAEPFEDPLVRRLRGPSPVMPSDIDVILKELMQLKREVKMIRRALEKHGIRIEEDV